ncbi:Ni/Fe hydrogenase subunit alpha [candidate division GN15 bacterium]|nr:Ni/Fe hydrogenase subunit alpha [candidate division GN15 bacterium]
MARKITISPVTRIEGHARITLQLNDAGVVDQARFIVTQFRGFEKFCEGRPFYEMPSLMARTCGICPVSHLIAGAKACDDLYAVQIPHPAKMLRRMMNLAQILQSHALNFFYLSLPDLYFGMDADPEQRNIIAVFRDNPSMARDGVALRQIGQEIIEELGGKRIHPAWVVPGGVNTPLTEDHREKILRRLPEGMAILKRTLEWFHSVRDQFKPELNSFGNFPSHYMGLVDEQGFLEHYDGKLRVMDAAGNIVVNKHDTLRYRDLIAEANEPWTYEKFPYLKDLGYPAGMYRVGPLARLNLVDACDTPLADEELKRFRAEGVPVATSFHYHWARLIEMIFCIERIEDIMNDPDILSKHVRAYAEPNSFDGIGVSEAPRGTLIHHYRIDENGLIVWADLVIATVHNNLAMNRAILQVAKNFVDGNALTDGALNRVEAVIRAFDPCLSCSTHADGTSMLVVELRDAAGQLLDSSRRRAVEKR